MKDDKLLSAEFLAELERQRAIAEKDPEAFAALDEWEDEFMDLSTVDAPPVDGAETQKG
jgi:hypothetical protein